MTITLKEGFKTPIAVVDWVAITVELGRNSNGGHIKKVYEHLGVSHADPIDIGADSAASKFEIRMQHPTNYAVIENLISDLDNKYGLVSAPQLCGLEVSIDFYHKTANILALEAMTERLMLSIAPAAIDNPRIIGERFYFSGGVMPKRSSINATKTLYIGNKWDDVMWRVYFKRTDDTCVGEDGKRVTRHLPPTEFRARAEVRLQGKALKQLNLVSVSDLRDLHFEKLHSAGLFKFAKRDYSSGQIFTNKFAMSGAKSLGIENDSPACVLNGFGRRDNRGRVRQLSHHLITDTELTEVSRKSLCRLSQRF